MARQCAPWILLILAACGGALPEGGTVPEPARNTLEQTALGQLMRQDVNPSYSRLSFMLFHAEEEEAESIESLKQTAADLREAAHQIQLFRAHAAPTDEGRLVFETFAAALTTEVDGLVASLSAGDRAASARSLERISTTCNSCHHFYRLAPVRDGSRGLLARRRLVGAAR